MANIQIKIRYIKHIFLIALTSFATLQCDKKTDVSITTVVKTEEGKNIAHANIYVNGKKIGTTNSSGIFEKVRAFKVGQKIKIEITKESEKFYYSDHQEIFTIPNKSAFNILVTAVLAYLPKNADLQKKQPALSENGATTKRSQPLPEKQKPTSLSASKPEKIQQPIKKVAIAQKKKDEATVKLIPPKIAKTPAVATVTAPIPPSPAFGPRMPTRAELRKISIIAAAAEDRKQRKKPTPKKKAPRHQYRIKVVSADQRPISKADIFIGWPDSGHFEKIGQSNARGEHHLTYFAPKIRKAKLIVQKQGYVNFSKTITLGAKKATTVSLKRAVTISIFAKTKAFDYERGIKKTEVLINNKSVGFTDQFGFFTWNYEGPKGDLLNIALRKKTLLPQRYSTDIVIANRFELTKFFQPNTPPRPKIFVSDVHIHTIGSQKEHGNTSFKKRVALAIDKHLMNKGHVSGVNKSVASIKMSQMGLDVATLVEEGWKGSELHPFIDAILVPELIIGKETRLFLNVITANGHHILSVYRNIDTQKRLDSVIKSAAQTFLKRFPFEATITALHGKKNVILNIGKNHSMGLKSGQLFDVFGIVYKHNGLRAKTENIARIRIGKLDATSSQAKVTWLAPLGELNIGDRVVRRRSQIQKQTSRKRLSKKTRTSSKTTFRVYAHAGSSKKSVAGASIFVNQSWIGTTNKQGILTTDLHLEGKAGVLVHKFGYSPKETNIVFSSKKKNYPLKMTAQESAMIMSSVPNGKKVFVDDQFVGTTPILNPIAVKTGFRRVTVAGGPGYKTWEKVIEITPLLLNLSGPRAVRLEKDFVSIATKFEKDSKYKKAIAYYSKVKAKESDYAHAQHAIGRIYLEHDKDPEKAAAAFEKVLTMPENRELIQKRFTVAYTNAGSAYFHLGNKHFKKNPKKSALYFKRAYENFQTAITHSEYFPKKSFERVKHDTLYYLALTYQKLYYLTNRKTFLIKAKTHWNNYLDFYNFAIHNKSSFKKNIKNANLYIAEAKATLGSK